jgi:hypothetical protein
VVVDQDNPPSRPVEERRGDRGPVAGRAVDPHLAVGGELARAVGKLVNGEVGRAGEGAPWRSTWWEKVEKWVWAWTTPGSTRSPRASSVRAAARGPAVIAAIRSPRTPTSARTTPPGVTTSPPETTRSRRGAVTGDLGSWARTRAAF